MLSPAAAAMRVGFPLLAVALAIGLFRDSRGHYVSFVCWLWFISPLIRRIVEVRGAPDASIILSTPYLVCIVPAVSMLYNWRSIVSRRLAPLLGMACAIFYGALVGVGNFGLVAVVQNLILWFPPLCFAFFLYAYRTEVQDMYRHFERSMIGATLFAGVYGIYQYFVLPTWDVNWMRSLGNNTFGQPKPMQVRVFSTLNAPQILALFLAVGIILALRSSSGWRFAAIPVGLVSITLSMARTAWVGLIVGFVYLVFRMSSKQRLQLFVIAAISCLAFAAAFQNPANYALVDRFNTLSDVGHDDSFVTRIDGHLALFERMGEFPFGLGLGSQQTGIDRTNADAMLSRGGSMIMQNDSSLAVFLISLGIVGGALGLTCMTFLGIRIARTHSLSCDSVALTAIMLLMASEFLLDNIVNGPAAFLLWSCIGFGLASVSYPLTKTKRLRFRAPMQEDRTLIALDR